MSRSCMGRGGREWFRVSSGVVLIEEYRRCKSMREAMMGMERQCGVVGDP